MTACPVYPFRLERSPNCQYIRGQFGVHSRTRMERHTAPDGACIRYRKFERGWRVSDTAKPRPNQRTIFIWVSTEF